jgi:hypothetical protein
MGELSREMRIQKAKNEGVEALRDDSNPPADTSARDRAQRAAEEFALDTKREHQEKIDANRDELMIDLGKVYDQALAEVMMRDDYSTDTPEGAAFFKAANEQKDRILIDLLDEAVAKNLDEKDVSLMEARIKGMIGG